MINAKGQLMLTPEEEAKIELIVTRAIAAYSQQVEKMIESRISVHEKTCEAAEQFRIMKAKFIGLLVGIWLSSAGVGGAVSAIMSVFMR